MASATPEANERWMDYRFTPGKGGTRVWDVINVANAADALRTAPVVREGASHELDSRLRADAPEVTRPGFGVYRVTVNFFRPDNSIDPSPFDEPPRIGWRTLVNSEPIDMDVEGNPIVASSYQGFDPPGQRDFNTKLLIYSRLEPAYIESKSESFENTVNDAPVFLYNGLRFDTGRMRLLTYEPVEDYPIDAQQVRNAYTFEIRPTIRNRGDAHQLRLRDEGTRGFYLRPGQRYNDQGYITTAGGDRCTTPVLLNGIGQPMDKTFKVEGRTPWPVVTPKGATLDARTDATWLVWKRYKPMSFNGLGIGRVR